MANRTNRRPAKPQPETSEAKPAKGAASTSPKTDGKDGETKPSATVVDLPLSGENLFIAGLRDSSARAQRRVQFAQDARQKLAQAADIFRQSDEHNAEGQAIAADAAFTLYQAQSSGLMTNDEVTALLGDVFGFNRKGGGDPVPAGHPKASKTPAGQGATVRKRVVRAVRAADFATSGQAEDKFFAILPQGDVAAIVNEMEGGHISIFTLYDRLQSLSREHQPERTHPAFDAKRVIDIADALSKPGAGDIIRNSPSLTAAYKAVFKALMYIGEGKAVPSEVEADAADAMNELNAANTDGSQPTAQAAE